MADDEVGQGCGDGVVAGGGKRQKHAAVAEAGIDGCEAVSRHDDAGGGSTEQSAHVAEALGAWHEDRVAFGQRSTIVGGNDASDGFVARHQRVAEARKGRHAAAPQQALGAGRDAAEGDVDHDVALARLVQLQPIEREALGGMQDDGEGVHRDLPGSAAWRQFG